MQPLCGRDASHSRSIATDRASLPGSFIRLTRGYVHYELSGPEDGPAIVLVPGLSVPYSTFDRNAPYLASRGFRVLRYDHYGRGFSDRPLVDYGLDTFVEQLAELLPAIGLTRPFVLLGLSMGGPVAAAAAARFPGVARALILVDPVYEWPEPGPAGRLLLAPFVGEAIMALGGARLLVRAQRRDFFDESSYREFIPRFLPPLRYRGLASAVLATMRSIPRWPLEDVYRELGRSGLSTLLFWGSEDAVLPFEHSERSLRAVPQAELHRVLEAGHVPHWEKADEVNAVLDEFLRRID